MNKKLSKRNQELISIGLNMVGHSNPLDPYFYIEESLYANEAKEIGSFIQWLYDTQRGYSKSTAQERWSEFKRGDKAPKHYFNLITTCEFDDIEDVDPLRIGQPTMDGIFESIKNLGYNTIPSNLEIIRGMRIENEKCEIVKQLTQSEIEIASKYTGTNN